MADSELKAPKVYQCPEYGLHYDSEEIVNQCEAWYKEYKSCNLEAV